ncbi:MAG: hypothetical protein EU541_00190 [Promethearchaeota archaeon]|nr:MAG: hypothetical protein EU541_00190 [Candidatus Lokiarchaeota archaeon]
MRNMVETLSDSKNINVVIIGIKSEKYLIKVEKVKEIYVPKDNIVPIPLADKTITGVIDIRGEVYSILSLRKKIYDEENLHHIHKDNRVLLLETNGVNLSILVDEVIGVKEIPTSVFNHGAPIIETDLDIKFIESVAIIEENTYILLDIDAFIKSFNIDLNYNRIEPISPSRKETKGGSSNISIETKRPDTSPISSSETYEIGGKLSELKDKIKLNPEQEDMLKEIGNIGSGNAVTALSRLIKKKIDIDLTNVGIVSFDNLTDQFGGPMEKVCGIFSQIKGAPQSSILQAFELKPLMKLISSLIGDDSQIDPENVSSKKDLDDFAISTITEMGNILAGHYASALADLTGTKMMINVPEFSVSDIGSIGKFLSQELKTIYTYIVVIKTSIKVVDYELNGVFLFIPGLDTLYKFFDQLGINYKPQESSRKFHKKSLNSDNLELTEIQRDALQEIGNIGSGNAANALAKMVNQKVTIAIPKVEMMTIDKFSKKLQTNDNLYTSWSNVKGKTRATVLTIFQISDIIEITAILTDDKKKKQLDLRKKYDSVEKFPEMYQSAMSELGNILASNYVSSLGDLLDIRLMTDPPDMIIDTKEQLFTNLRDQIGFLEKLSLVITTAVIITDIKIEGAFLFVPEIETLHELLKALEKFY